ncbi:MAG: substrate-binding domain-containing protein [Pirellulaceae bacterium]|nr:substrate-binding domain-containing protein [Pirellulaceae bacterium]
MRLLQRNPAGRVGRQVLCLVIALGTSMSGAAAQEPAAESDTVRCAVIGGMGDTGLFEEVARRFEKQSKYRVRIVAAGPKREIAEVFQRGEADLITMHASDTIINLVADGYGVDPQPWARNDLLLVGPPSDPAKVRGETDAVVALQKIVAAKSQLLMHSSLGANEVLADLLAAGEITLDPARVTSLPSDRHREMLKRAAAEQAYTVVGRIPFLNAKIPRHDMEIMVQGDPRLRRPYVVVVARGDESSTRIQAARALQQFLRNAETQEWLLAFGRGKYDSQPLFFPVVVDKARGHTPPDKSAGPAAK